MARVFVSYRRADGVYGVGWLAERLRALDSITGVETAFHDAGLRAGDDFHDALDAEIEGSDLVIAVIGPNWLGQRPDGSARIREGDDWVVREIAAAFAQSTTVLPVLVDAAEHPLAAQVHDSIHELARLHALPFADGRDLDTIVDHVESHLTDIDQERAKLAGLEEPVIVPRLERPWLVIGAAVVAAVTGALFGWVLASYRACADGASCDFQGATGYDVYEVILPIFGAFAGATGVVGLVLAHRLHRVAAHRWLPIVGTLVLVAGMLLLLSLSSRSGHYALTEATSMNAAGWRFLGNLLLVTLSATMSAGILLPLFSRPRASEHDIAERVRTLGIERDAERWAAITVSVEFALVSLAGAAILAALDQADAADTVGPLPNITFAFVFSAVLLILHNAASARLDERQAAIERALTDVPPRYRQNATPRLMASAFEHNGWPFRAILALPLIVTLIAAAIEPLF